MTILKQVLFLSVTSFFSLNYNAAQGASPGQLSKEMCEKYSKYVPDTYDCPFLKESLSIGNQFAESDEFSHMVLLGYKTEDSDEIQWSCSASLISDQYVLAAAHCLSGHGGHNISVARLGITDIKDTAHLQEIKIAELIPHPDYKSPSAYNDIGLVKLQKKVDISVHTRPACLYTEKDIGVNQAINSGWGSTEFAGEFNDRLQKVVLEIYEQEGCNRTYHGRSAKRKIKDGINYNIMLCAGTKTLITNQPNSGGPLLIVHKEGGKPACLYDIIGVASFGKPGVKKRHSERIHQSVPIYQVDRGHCLEVDFEFNTAGTTRDEINTNTTKFPTIVRSSSSHALANAILI
ncbi:hypothetical protein NQ315_008528 [Exocentrus adspersus]|uniref:Peptidase S1 domain-containing protein n=1 Tax=Exocentrus adspersus TaxID=1586481 RepID=A0AAV8W5K5_9CUCU|nr:hypothetical protein NQ315_008528 [Exocentrus adspersus]